MRLVLDPSACDGFGFCAQLAPRSIALDEWGFPLIAPGVADPEERTVLAAAVASCPRRALRLAP